MSYNYNIVLPRDAFNQAKLLKCLGRLTLLIEDRLAPEWISYELKYPYNQFVFSLNDDNRLFCENLVFEIKGIPHQRHIVYSVYNSKDNYPLVLELGNDFSPINIFNEDGSFTQEFLNIHNNV